MDYHVWSAMLECYQRYVPKLTNTTEQRTVLLTTWNNLLQRFIDVKVIVSFCNRLRSCVAAVGVHSKHSV